MNELYATALALTLSVELPIVLAGYRRVAPAGRRLAVALAVNLATHGLLWMAWASLPGAWFPRVILAEIAVVLAEAIAYRLLLGGSPWRAATVSVLANAASTIAGVALPQLVLT